MAYGTPVCKMVTDPVSVLRVTTVMHKSYPSTCEYCDHVTGAAVPGIQGTEFGPNLPPRSPTCTPCQHPPGQSGGT